MTTTTLTLSTLPFESDIRLPQGVGGMYRVCRDAETFNEVIDSLIEKYGDAPVVETNWSKYDWSIAIPASKRYFRIESAEFQEDRESKDKCVANYYNSLGYKGD